MKPMFKGTGKKDWFPVGGLFKIFDGALGDCIKDSNGVHWWHPRETTYLEERGYIVKIQVPRIEENE